MNKISYSLSLAVLIVNLNDWKRKKYNMLVASATCVLNREYVITNYTYINENSVQFHIN